jgi:isopenicillin N synthase-like dioxygenase
MQRIPLIDLGSSAGVAGEIEKACRDVGFMYLANHRIPARLIDDVRKSVVHYFEQPVEAKLRDRITSDNYRAYIPFGFFSANSGDGDSDADSYEGYKLHFEVPANDPLCKSCELYGPNKWPANPPGFQHHLLNYWQECDRIAAVLLGAMAEVLGTSKDDFLELFESPLTNMTLLHYPPQDPDETGFGIHPHKDTDALTILAEDPVGGLMIKCRDSDEWIDAEAPGDALTVNIGDLMELWSGGYFVSTPHKVVNASGAERYSFPYFAVPRFDTVVEPLITPQAGFSRSSVHVGDVSKEVWRTNWPDVVSDKPHFDLGTLED